MRTRSHWSAGSGQEGAGMFALGYEGGERKAIQMMEQFVNQTISQVEEPVAASSPLPLPPARTTRKRKNAAAVGSKKPAKKSKRISRISSGYESSDDKPDNTTFSSQPSVKEEKGKQEAEVEAEVKAEEVVDKENQQPNADEMITPINTRMAPPAVDTQNYQKQPKHLGRALNFEQPETPVARPWKDIVKTARERNQTGKRRSSRLSVPTRHSARLGGEVSVELPTLNRQEQLIQKRMQELQEVDNRDLKRQLKELGKIKSTPPVNGRVTYDLQNPASINRKYIDDLAEMYLEEGIEPGVSELQQRPGIQHLGKDF